ncbi:hypothetical protein [Rhizobium sp. RM]|uniref:hypothetical protein n=1 Tax=Rhizobium sp. RM TaxID=2748079 RepID=UPI00110E599C|nr:hypothetical protein [Rhizobium sp. RM]NWJ27488.1 hypothetical protein [Rhizobium sp. RM]TMV20047.1 hypothetical protein BJG94_11715 [Rhizobium sp. Td3]
MDWLTDTEFKLPTERGDEFARGLAGFKRRAETCCLAGFVHADLHIGILEDEKPEFSLICGL